MSMIKAKRTTINEIQEEERKKKMEEFLKTHMNSDDPALDAFLQEKPDDEEAPLTETPKHDTITT